MAYPALRQMAERNRARFGREVGPAQPYLSGARSVDAVLVWDAGELLRAVQKA